MLAYLRSRRILARIAGNSAWMLGEQALRAAVGVVVGAIVARHLGPDAFGLLAVAFACLMLLTSAAGLGLGSVVIRDLVKAPLERPRILGTAAVVLLGAATVVFIVGNLLVRAADEPPYDLAMLVLVASCSLLFQSSQVVDYLLQSELRGRDLSAARSAGFLASSGARLAFVAAGAPLLCFAAAPVVEAAVTAAALLLVHRATGGRISRWGFDRRRAAELVRTSLPLAVSGFFVIGLMQADRIMLGGMAGEHEAGLYAAASLLSAPWYTVPVIIGASVAPTLTELHEHRRSDYERKLGEVFAGTTALSLAIGAAVSLLAAPLIGLIFGSAFDGAAPVLVIHVWTGVFVAHVSIRTRALLIEDRGRVILALSGLTLLANVALNALLIPRGAALGAATASLLSWALAAAVLPLLFAGSRRYPGRLLRSFSPLGWVRALGRGGR